MVVDDSARAKRPAADVGSTEPLPMPRPVVPPLSADLRRGAESFAMQLDRLVEKVLVPTRESAAPGATAGQDPPGVTADDTGADSSSSADSHGVISRPVYLERTVNPDMLLAAFLKLNITDPNNSVDTHNKLHELATRMRQQALENAKKALQNARELMMEALRELEKAEAMAEALMILSILLAVVAMIAGQIMAIIAALIKLVAEIVVAQMQLAAQLKMADAKELENYGKGRRLNAEINQNQVEDETEIMKRIMEDKNRTVDAVIKMSQLSFASSSKLLSASISQG